MSRRWLLLGALALAACSNGPKLAAGRYQGVVELHERVLGFEMPGRIQTRPVERGAKVPANEVLATLDDTLERQQLAMRAADAKAADAQLDLLKAGPRAEDVRVAQAQVRSAKAHEDTLRTTVERDRALRAAHAIAQAQLDEAEGALNRATADRQAAENRLAALIAGARSQEVKAALARSAEAHAALDAEQERLARFTLRAPVAGEVLDTHAEPGEIVQAGTPVITLGEPKRPYVDVFVPEAQLAGLRVGTPAVVHVDGSDETFRGEIQSIGRTLEFTPRYLFSPHERPNLVMRVRVDVEDPREHLHAGVPAFVDFQQPGNAVSRGREPPPTGRVAR